MSYFEINVANKQGHYFATSPRSITSNDKAKLVLADLIQRFPANEGFKISVSFHPEIGYDSYNTEINLNNYDKLIDKLSKNR